MEPTIYIPISIYYFLFTLIYYVFLIPSINTISYFEARSLEKKKEKIVVGKVIVAKAIGIFILYIGRIRFVINRLGKGKEITERKEIN